MEAKDRIILEEYRKVRQNFVQAGEIVHEMLAQLVKDGGLMVLGIEHRVKTESSLEGKLYRTGDYYRKLEDLTDLLGARVICCFADEVDIIGKLVEQAFVIDWENSSDKRALLRADSFGYLSLHYICSLPKSDRYPEELCSIRFEIQIRTILQHAWAAIEHDLGYKSEFGVPRAVVRNFSRLAGLLELADDEFVRSRDTMRQYTEETRSKIIENRADDVPIDMVSLREYMKRNKVMQAFLQELGRTAGAEIDQTDPESYLQQLSWLGKKTIGDLQKMLEDGRALALRQAQDVFGSTDLDILSSNVALRLLCRAELVQGGYTQAQAAEFLALSVKNRERAERQAAQLMATYGKQGAEQ